MSAPMLPTRGGARAATSRAAMGFKCALALAVVLMVSACKAIELGRVPNCSVPQPNCSPF